MIYFVLAGFIVVGVGGLVLFVVALERGWINDPGPPGDDSGQGPSLN